MPAPAKAEIEAVPLVLKLRFALYGFSLTLCVVLAGIGGHLLVIRAGSYGKLLMAVGAVGVIALFNVLFLMNAAYHTTRLRQSIGLSIFIVMMHIILFVLQLVAIGLVIGNRSNFTCDRLAAPNSAYGPADDLLPIFPKTVCETHFAYFILLFVSFGCTCLSEALCFHQDKELRKFLRGRWHHLIGKSVDKHAHSDSQDTAPLPRPRPRLPGASKQEISRPEVRKSWIAFKSRDPRPAPSRASWISWKAREPAMQMVPPVPALPRGQTSRFAEGLDLEAPHPFRGEAVSAPHALRMPPRTYAGNGHPTRMPQPGRQATAYKASFTPAPTKPLRPGRPYHQVDYSLAKANANNMF
ncbi:hypothetical protein AURDEDRAFT_180880 [Auricularia subglabra TFB-10046 SS5]|nr:hypothetical protein AURDEDRAFT_180880 [Auricularia subglabra TFB-10046 SS5]